MDNNNNTQQTHGHTEMPSDVMSTKHMDLKALDCGMKAVDAKATRWIAAQYGLHASQLETLSIVWCWLFLNGKLDVGGAAQTIVDWSGARRAWKRRIDEGIRECIGQGVIDKTPSRNGGFRIKVSQKGLYILQQWRVRTNELSATWLQERVKI